MLMTYPSLRTLVVRIGSGAAAALVDDNGVVVDASPILAEYVGSPAWKVCERYGSRPNMSTSVYYSDHPYEDYVKNCRI
jgi:hypothetical protein